MQRQMTSQLVYLEPDTKVRCSNCTAPIKPWRPRMNTRECCQPGAAHDAELRRRHNYPALKAQQKTIENCERFMQTGVCINITNLGWCRFHHPPVDQVVHLEFEGPRRCRICTLPLPCNVHFPEIGAKITDLKFLQAREQEALEQEENDFQHQQGSQELIEQQVNEDEVLKGGESNGRLDQEGSRTGSNQTDPNTSARNKLKSKKLSLRGKSKKASRVQSYVYQINEVVAVFHQDAWRFAYLLDENKGTGMVTLSLKSRAKPPRNTVLLNRNKIRAVYGTIFDPDNLP